jgi:hypothetical protein
LHAGRAKNTELNPDTARCGVEVEVVDAPEGMDVCCHGAITLALDQLDDYQELPYGTHAWALSYGRRNLVENTNGLLAADGLQRSAVAAFGDAARGLAALDIAVAHNIEVSIAFSDAELTDDEQGERELPPAPLVNSVLTGASNGQADPPEPPEPPPQ